MVCGKCGAENPDGSTLCSSCGQPVAGDTPEFVMPGKLAMMKMMVQADPTLALISIGWMIVTVGAFTPWVSSGGTGVLGLNSVNGGSVLVVAMVCLIALLLSRSATPGPWGIIIALLALLEVALVFQALYFLKDNSLPIAGGYWVSMVGVLAIGYGAYKEVRKAK